MLICWAGLTRPRAEATRSIITGLPVQETDTGKAPVIEISTLGPLCLFHEDSLGPLLPHVHSVTTPENRITYVPSWTLCHFMSLP